MSDSLKESQGKITTESSQKGETAILKLLLPRKPEKILTLKDRIGIRQIPIMKTYRLKKILPKQTNRKRQPFILIKVM